MASCGKCGRDVGCGCNLIDGVCMSCYNATLPQDSPTVSRATRKQIVSYSQPDAKPITEFEQILNTPNITKQEKIRRINDILEKARLQL
jgi:hypothetical protein